jgi:hypothetical protein
VRNNHKCIYNYIRFQRIRGINLAMKLFLIIFSYLSVIHLESKLRMRANRERDIRVTNKLTNKIQGLMRQEEDNYNQDILPTIDTQSNPKFKKMQKRKIDDNFYQIQKYDNMLDDKLVELRDLLKKEK